MTVAQQYSLTGCCLAAQQNWLIGCCLVRLANCEWLLLSKTHIMAAAKQDSLPDNGLTNKQLNYYLSWQHRRRSISLVTNSEMGFQADDTAVVELHSSKLEPQRNICIEFHPDQTLSVEVCKKIPQKHNFYPYIMLVSAAFFLICIYVYCAYPAVTNNNTQR